MDLSNLLGSVSMTDATILILALGNVIQFFWKFLVKNQEAKDQRQDDRVEALKVRVDQIEGAINSKLDTIVDSLNKLNTSITISTEKTKTIFANIDGHTRDIENLQKEVSDLKERLAKLEN